ncbi:MAG: hypothetical protein AMXMBFR82_50020 [Candidatus Hydrogenedentota bacterium]
MRLPHILIPTVFVALTFAFVARLVEFAGFNFGGYTAIHWILAAVLYFAGLPIYWQICRRLNVPPLFVFAPACPHCGERPSGWKLIDAYVPETARFPERLILACGQCSEKVELWLQRRVDPEARAQAFPSYRLRWPEFLGIWSRLPGKQDSEESTAL